MKQEIKVQIRQMVDEEYPHNHFEINRVQRKAATYGAEAVMQRLDIDLEAVINACIIHASNGTSEEEAKKEILNAITLKP